ncbi:MAG TPA: DUF5681 domain-containing protein [Stellaceae bacterium]|nr:DUF5681 domain-containing protein [Stellaceae bacterium]
MASDERRDYQIGRGRPPLHARFQKGRSGNPRGRPPGAKSLATLLVEALNQPVAVAENGRRRKMTKREVVVAQLVNQSASADPRATKLLLDMIRDLERRAEASAAPPPALAAADAEVVAHLIERLRTALHAELDTEESHNEAVKR